MPDQAEYTPQSSRPWANALDASDKLDRVVAEFIDRVGKVGADEDDMAIASQVLVARSTLALADALHGVRQEMTLVSSQLHTLTDRLDRLITKFPAL